MRDEKLDLQRLGRYPKGTGTQVAKSRGKIFQLPQRIRLPALKGIVALPTSLRLSDIERAVKISVTGVQQNRKKVHGEWKGSAHRRGRVLWGRGMGSTSWC